MKILKKIILFIFIIFVNTYFSPGRLFADTIIPSEINRDTTLTEAGSPYIAQGLITINAVLTVEAGVHIKMAGNSQIKVLGGLQINGTEQKPVLMKPGPDSLRWKGITSSHATLSLSYTHIEKVTSALVADYGEVTLTHCLIKDITYNDGVHLKHMSYAKFENCRFFGKKDYSKIDAIDCDNNGSKQLIFAGNRFYNFSDDAIDIGNSSTNVQIYNNLIVNCASMGISIGENSQAVIQRNIVIGCKGGVEIHTGSYGYIDHNTLYANRIGVYCWHNSNSSGSGGTAEVVNSIISNSADKDYSLISSSSFSCKYSLSDKNTLPGEGNLLSDPRFMNPAVEDFRLRPDSPCINTGDPQYPKDADSSRTDMGAKTFLTGDQIVINEINYHAPSPESSDYQFIEIVNVGQKTFDLSDCRFSLGIGFTFPQGTLIYPQEYFLIAKDSSVYSNLNNRVFQWTEDSLDYSGETILLEDNEKNVLDYVIYQTGDPWPPEANGTGPTLELKNSLKDNALAENWAASLETGGTPGAKNSTATGIVERSEKTPGHFIVYQNYPNPFNSSTTITYKLATPSYVKIEVFSLSGQKVTELISEKQQSGEHTITWYAGGQGRDLASGIYFLHLSLRDENNIIYRKTKKMVLIK